MSIIGVVIAVVVSVILTGETRPPTGLPAVGVVDYVADSGHRTHLAAGNLSLVVETSQLPGGVAFGDAPSQIQMILENLDQALEIYWLTEQIAAPDGPAHTEFLSITEAGLSLHAVASDEANYHLSGPGVVTLPLEPAVGDQWSGRATAINNDGSEVEFTRRASIAAGSQPDCLEITYHDQLGDTASTSVITRCRGQGITGIIAEAGGFAPASPQSRNAASFVRPEPLPSTANQSPQQLAIRAGAVVMSLGMTTAPVPLGDGLLLANRTNGQVIFARADDDSTWEIGWRQRPGEATVTLLGAGEMAIAATTDRKLVAYDASGRWLWEHETTDLVANLVRVGADSFAAVSLDGTLSVRSLADGEQLWQASVPAGGPAVPQVLNGAQGPVLAATAGRQLVLATAEGNHRQLRLSDSVEAATVAGNLLLTADTSGNLIAFQANGSLAWRDQLRDPCYELRPFGELVVCRTARELIAYQAADGSPAWRTKFAALALISLDGQLLASGRSNDTLFAVDGSVVDQWPVTRNASSTWPLQLPSGALVIGSDGSGNWWPR